MMSKIIVVCSTLIWLQASFLGQCLAQKEPAATLPKPPFCGVTLSDRLIGGLQTQMSEFQWTALIQYRKSDGQTAFRCGGTLINSRYVLTAAHCVKTIPRDLEVISVRLGEWDLAREVDCEDVDCTDAPVDMPVEKIIVHEDYARNKSHYNDIALIRLNGSVNMSEFISPVCLPIDEQQRSQNLAGLKGYVAGWRRTDNSGPSNMKLKFELDTKDSDSCANIFGRFGVILKDTQICARGFDRSDYCSSSLMSGTPFTKQEKLFNYLYGISSMGPSGCGNSKDIPEVYTNVAKYVDWIESKLE